MKLAIRVDLAKGKGVICTNDEAELARAIRVAFSDYRTEQVVVERIHERIDIDLDPVEALRLILADPHGCPWCDSGQLRIPGRGHSEQCGFARAKAIVAQRQA